MTYKEEIENKFNNICNDLKPKFESAVLRLELANMCNHQCQFCINSKLTRKRIHMEDYLIFKIIKEAADLGVKKFGLFMNGEPFISTRLAEYIKYAKQQGGGRQYVFITTNGALATEESLAQAFEAGLDSIKFSINAGSRETYKKVHGKDDFNTVISNLRFAHKFRTEHHLNYKILSSFVVTQDNVHEIDLQYNSIKPYVDDIVFFKLSNYAGQVVDKKLVLGIDFHNDKVDSFQADVIAKSPCPMLFNSINVTAEGYLTLCCSEAMNYMVIEDLHEKSLKEAWYSESMCEQRKRHMEGKIEGTQCYNCINNVLTEVQPLNKNLYMSSQKV